MYFNNLKSLRINKELTQQDIANTLKCPRSTYNNWERGIVMIPLHQADNMSIYYNVRLSYILGLEKFRLINYKIKPINYKILKENLMNLKNEYKHSYEYIGNYIGCDSSTCQRYFTGNLKIPIDRLVLLSKLYNCDLDKLCGKE